MPLCSDRQPSCADLMRLRLLVLAGNPIMGAPFARLRALACLPQRSQGLRLDGTVASPGEMSALAACGGERLPDEFAVISRLGPCLKALLQSECPQPAETWCPACWG